jgi:hypothetical protein
MRKNLEITEKGYKTIIEIFACKNLASNSLTTGRKVATNPYAMVQVPLRLPQNFVHLEHLWPSLIPPFIDFLF